MLIVILFYNMQTSGEPNRNQIKLSEEKNSYSIGS